MSEQRNLVLRQNLALSNLKSCPAFVTNTIENPEQAKCGGIFCKFPVISYNTTKGNFAKPAVANFLLFLIQVISKNAKMGTKKAANPLNRFTAFGCRQNGGYSVVDCGAIPQNET